jgi:hypothetical protein
MSDDQPIAVTAPVLYVPDMLPAWLAGERHHHVLKSETAPNPLGRLGRSEYFKVTERVVPVVPPAMESVECPTCEGRPWTLLSICCGYEWVLPTRRATWEEVDAIRQSFVDATDEMYGDHDRVGIIEGPCPTCDGKGQVTVLAVGAEQYRNKKYGRAWHFNMPAMVGGNYEWERRTVVAYQLVGVEKLPVVAAVGPHGHPTEDWPKDDHIRWYRTAGIALWRWKDDGPWPIDADHEPWAVGLAPGDLVIRWRAIRKLDEPIIDQACPTCRGEVWKTCPECRGLGLHRLYNDRLCPKCFGKNEVLIEPPCPTCSAGQVPLVLTPGLCEVTP